ncbi:aromatic compound dioxygenase [Penicillium frequentans]|nr:aromatic compound dioxygenase [Penicillium glabrum]
MQLQSIIFMATVGLATVALAHPGHNEVERRDLGVQQFKARVRRDFENCAAKREASGLNARAEARRKATLDKYRRQLKSKRDTTTVLDTSHLYTGTDVTVDSDESVVFSDSGTCVLNPEGEVGPFYVKGELIREDVRDDEEGVPIVLEAQFLDVSTCEPIEGAYWDIWNCNSTGVYSGVVSSGNGNTADTGNLDKIFLRGIQETDSDGVATFESIFPGHYSGRATHHHVVLHLDATVLSNGTLTSGTVPHIGQLFWDQSLISIVEATSPYSTNTIELTTNAEDRVFAAETEDSTSDPVFEYVYIGDDVSDGIFGWVTIAVDTTAEYTPTYSFEYTSSGGEAVSSSSSSGSGSGSGGSGGAGGAGGSGGAGGH